MCWSVRTAVRGLKAYNDALRDIARERNVPLLELERRIPKTFDLIGDFVAGELVRLDALKMVKPDEPLKKIP